MNMPTIPLDRPFTREEILTLKVAQLMLHRGQVENAFKSLAAGVRFTGRQGTQLLILAGDFNELDRHVKESSTVGWPELPPHPKGPELPYHSVLLCFHAASTDLYFNGLPLGKIVDGAFLGHEFAMPGAPTKRPMTFRDIQGNPYATEQEFKDAVCAAIQAIHFP